MEENNYSIFCIPKVDIVKIKDEEFKFDESFSEGSIGTALLMSELLKQFDQDKIPVTMYLYGKGVISNEWSDSFNWPSGRPDILVCQGALRPRLLVDAKYNEFNHRNTDINDFVKTLTQGERTIILCNVECFDEYLKSAQEIDCPAFIIKVWKIRVPTGYTIHYLGLKVSPDIKSKFIVAERGKSPRRKVFMAKYEDMLVNEALFAEIKKYFDKGNTKADLSWRKVR